MGELRILNVAGGDIKISFDKNNAAEAIRAKRMIKDMMRRGYALLIEQPDGTHTRALDFDESVGEYIIADLDPELAAQPFPKLKDVNEQSKETEPEAKKAKRGRKAVKMESVRAVGVAPSAGG